MTGMKGVGVVFVLFAFCADASAQYYEEQEYRPVEARYVSVGFMNRDFTPKASNTLPDSARIHYSRIMPMISFRQGSGELMFGYTTYDLNGGSKSTIFFGGRFGGEVPIAGRRPFMLLFPLQLSADFTKAEGLGPSREDFNIASVGIGAGLKFRYFTSSVDFSVAGEELAQYSTEGIGVGNGFSASTVGEMVVLLRDFGPFEGTVIGYRFRLQTWSMNEAKFNYRSISHGPYIGLMF